MPEMLPLLGTTSTFFPMTASSASGEHSIQIYRGAAALQYIASRLPRTDLLTLPFTVPFRTTSRSLTNLPRLATLPLLYIKVSFDLYYVSANIKTNYCNRLGYRMAVFSSCQSVSKTFHTDHLHPRSTVESSRHDGCHKSY